MGRPGVAELAVVVVLDHPGARPLRPREQREPARRAHDDAEGKLVRWGDVRESRARRRARARRDVHSLAVDGDGDHARARRDEGRARAHVPGILHPHGVPGLREHARDEIERLLRAAHDEHLLRGAARTARAGDVRSDRVAQRAVARRGGVAEEDGAGAPSPRGEPGPERGGERIDRRHAERERHGGGVASGAPAGELGAGARPARGHARGRARRRRARRRRSLAIARACAIAMDADEGIGDARPHARSATAPRRQIALGAELIEGEYDGVARDAELRGEDARGGESRVGRECAGAHVGAQCVVDLAVQRLRRSGVERDEERRGIGRATAAPARRIWTSRFARIWRL